jgi:hypothetical protein
MRVQVDNPALLTSLLSFLRSQGCIVEQVGIDTLAVWCPPVYRNGDSPHAEMTCRSCGTPVAEALGRLGSLRCHDCRDEGHETLLPGVYGHAHDDRYGHAHDDRSGRSARGDLAAYIAEWQAGHSDVRAVIV